MSLLLCILILGCHCRNKKVENHRFRLINNITLHPSYYEHQKADGEDHDDDNDNYNKL